MNPATGRHSLRHLAFMLAALTPALCAPIAGAAARSDASIHKPAKVRVSQTFEWIATAPAAGILWLGVEEPYRVTVSSGCGDLLAAPPQHISVHGHTLQIGNDELFNQTGHCRITHLQEADPQQLQSTGLRRENARRLVALRVTGTSRQK